jgi:hypothetical protein
MHLCLCGCRKNWEPRRWEFPWGLVQGWLQKLSWRYNMGWTWTRGCCWVQKWFYCILESVWKVDGAVVDNSGNELPSLIYRVFIAGKMGDTVSMNLSCKKRTRSCHLLAHSSKYFHCHTHLWCIICVESRETTKNVYITNCKRSDQSDILTVTPKGT